MAVAVATIPAPPDRVFGVLSDPYAYADWVVGSDTVRDADPTWPAPGSKLHHRLVIGPFRINDDTQVLEAAPPRRLVLKARSRPLGTARVVLELHPEGRGTRVRMLEQPGDIVSRIFHNPLFDKLMEKRNVEALRRLARIATDGERRPQAGSA
jgi:uncharacterized protein YndB with AHSA1/START domain